MITTIAKQSRKIKRKEWNIYHNIGVQHDAERFSLIDNVLDGELNDYATGNEKEKTGPNSNVFARVGKKLTSQLRHHIFRTYLFCWFSVYFGAFVIGKLLK